MNAPNGLPADLDKLFKSAAEARKHHDYQLSFDILERARQEYPNTVVPLLELGNACGTRYDFAKARHYFDEAIRLAGRRTQIYAIAGLHSLKFGNYEMAREYFGSVAERDDATGDALTLYAEILERQRQFDESREIVERALKLSPQNPVAVLVSAKLHRQAGSLPEAEKNLRTFLAATPDKKFPVSRCWYELGGNLDKQGRYDEAMDAFLQAKALLAPQAEPHLTKLLAGRQGMRETEAEISVETIERWSKNAENLEPLRRFTILSGHPRSGTTLLEQVLDSHPDVISADENRIFLEESWGPVSRQFANDVTLLQRLDSQSTADLQRIRSVYFRYIEFFMGQAVNGRMLMEKNPALSGMLSAALRIFPEARFLVAIRDPRDVCLSCFMQPLPLNPISSSYLTLEGTVDQYTSAMNTWNLMLPLMRNPHLLVRYEDVIENLEAESRRVLEFLGIAWDKRVLKFDEHARTKTVRSPTYADVAKPIFKTAKGRWHNYQKYLEPWLGKLEPFVKKFGYE